MPRLLCAFAVAVCLSGSSAAAEAAQQSSPSQITHTASPNTSQCSGDLGAALAEASSDMQQARFAEAATTLQPLAARQCDPRVSLLLSAALEGSGDKPAAEAELEQAHSVWPANNSIAASLAREYLGAGETTKAAQALSHFHATAGTPVQELDLAAVVFLAAHQLESARAVAQAEYQFYPTIHSLLLLANALQLEGRYKDVIALLASKRETYAQSAPFLVTLAESEYDANIFDAARADLEHAILLDAHLYQAHYLLGNVLLKQGSSDQAAAEYRQAIELAPEQPRAYYQLALALRAQEDEAGEEAVLTRAVAIEPHYALAHSELGRILVNQNRLPEAVQQLNSAIEDNPSAEQPYYLLAKVYDRLGDPEKSQEMTRRLAALKCANHHLTRAGAAAPLATP